MYTVFFLLLFEMWYVEMRAEPRSFWSLTSENVRFLYFSASFMEENENKLILH